MGLENTSAYVQVEGCLWSQNEEKMQTMACATPTGNSGCILIVHVRTHFEVRCNLLVISKLRKDNEILYY